MSRRAKRWNEKNFFLIMIIIAIVDIVAQLCLLVFSYNDTDGCTLWFLEKCSKNVKINEDDLIFTIAINIIFRYIFSRLLLTIYITYHNKVSIIITAISFVPLKFFKFNIISYRQNKIG